MEQVCYYDLPFSALDSETSTVYIGYHDQILLNISNIVSCFASNVVNFTLRGTHNSGLTALTSYYYDYVCQSPYNTVITASTGGLYEFPYGGGFPYVQISFDVPATAAGTMTVIYPKIAN